MTKEQAHKLAEKAFAAHCFKVEATLRAMLPLAEAYLKDAPSSPDNAILEDARALLSTSLAPANLQQRPGSAGRAHQFTAKEKEALREAATFRLSAEMEEEHYRAALERALEKL